MGSQDSGVHIRASLSPRCTFLAVVLLASGDRRSITRGSFLRGAHGVGRDGVAGLMHGRLSSDGH